jgi:ATP-dependent helicase/nuclease subunit A
VETLSRSYRSRPPLVDVTNAIFSRAFATQQGMPADRVRIEPARVDSPRLGTAVAHWPLRGSNKDALAESAACGVRALLAARPLVCDRYDGEERPATGGDVAILCRTNEQCRFVSESLGRRGIASVVARVGLLETAEAKLLLAGLALWVDPRDRLATATLVRILDHPQNAAAFVSEVLDEGATWDTRPSITRVLSAREGGGDADVIRAIDAVTDALDLRNLCAGWGDDIQRVANLDAFRAHAMRYCAERAAGGDAPTLVGFLAYLDAIVAEGPWGQLRREDTMARTGSGDAVTVSTWHASKGLEWPIVVLFGLETMNEPRAYGVHVLSDRAAFNVDDPLGQRWIHFWPNPYTNGIQNGPVKDAYARSPAFQHIQRQADREALRVLYVGWTRARDQVVLAARKNELLGGLLGVLDRIEPGVIAEPSALLGDVPVRWAGHPFTIRVTPFEPIDPDPVVRTPGEVRVGRPPSEYAVATLAPSSAPIRPGRLGDPVVLGAATQLRGAFEADALGEAIHDFLAADTRGHSNDRQALAAGLLEHYRVAGALDTGQLLEVADRFWTWIEARFGGGVIRREWPLGLRLPSGTLVRGAADVVVDGAATVAIIDHKSFGLAAARGKVDVLAGQLGCYADMAARARPGGRISTWVHLPLAGVVAEVILE